MSKLQVHQFTSSIAFGDAVSNHIFDTANALQDAGYGSKIFVEHVPSIDLGHRIYAMDAYEKQASPDSILLAHFSLSYSAQVLTWLRQHSAKKIIVYHNITPHTYFHGVNQGLADAARHGRRQLQHLSHIADTAIGVSRYNCDELRANGWETVYQLPISFDIKRYEAEPSDEVMQWGQEGVNILFVGRIAPNKKFEDLLLAFYYVKKMILPEARLVLVGSDQGMQPYAEYLQAIIEQLQLEDVYITGHVSMAELVAYYRTASIYLSMSEHEGFGVPLLESIYFDVPVLAYKSSAVPEILSGQGILFTEKRYEAIAELIGLIVNNKEFQQKIIQNQRATLEKFSYTAFQEQLFTVLRSIQQ